MILPLYGPHRGLALALLLAGTFGLRAGTFFVGPSGTAGAAGTQADPYFLVQEAIDQCVSGADTVRLLPGTYGQQFGIYGRDGIWLGSHDPADPAIISGSGLSGLYQLVIRDASDITVSGLVFREHFVQEAKAIYVLGEGNGIYLIDNEIHDVGWGNDPTADPEAFTPVRQAHAILVNGRGPAGYRNVYVGRNHLHDLVVGNSEALTLAGNVQDFLIEDNRVERVTNIGIDVSGHYPWAYPDSLPAADNQARNGRVRANTVSGCRRPTPGNDPAGIYVDGAANVYVDQNTVFDNGTGISVGCENPGKSASAIIVANNLIRGNDRFGTVFGANAGDVVNALLRNNTYAHNGAFFDNSGGIALQRSTQSLVRNNLLYVATEDVYGLSLFGYAVSDLAVDHNLFFGPDGNTARTFVYSPASGSTALLEDPIRFADPLLADTARDAFDAHLRPGSPAIDAGSPDILLLPLEVDLDGDPRMAEDIDIGADEYVAPDTTSGFGTNGPVALSVFPNPAAAVVTVQAEGLRTVTLYDAAGRACRSVTVDGFSATLDLAGLPPGRYALVAAHRGGVARRALVVAR
jgi:hypothetical protein